MAIISITPQLRTTDLAATLRFYVEKLGFTFELNPKNLYAGVPAATASTSSSVN